MLKRDEIIPKLKAYLAFLYKRTFPAAENTTKAPHELEMRVLNLMFYTCE